MLTPTLLASSFRFKAFCVAVETGLLASLVLVTLPKPTFEALIPVAIFASVTLASRIFAVLTALSASFPVVTAALVISGASAVLPVPAKSPPNKILPFTDVPASGILPETICASTYVFTAFWVGNKLLLVPKLVLVDLLSVFSLAFNAVCCAKLTSLLASLVLSTLSNNRFVLALATVLAPVPPLISATTAVTLAALPVILPVKFAVMVPAEKLPDTSLFIIALFVFELVAAFVSSSAV